MLLHGWSLNLHVFDELTAELSRRFRVIAIDLPGHGGSDWDASARTPAAHSWRVHETLAPLTERYTLLGWSLGGQYALDLAAALPAGIERLALVSTTPRFLAAPGWPYGTAPALLAKLAERLQRNDPRALDDFMRLQVRGNTPRTAARVLKTLRAALKAGAARPMPWRTDSSACATPTCARHCPWCAYRRSSSPAATTASCARRRARRWPRSPMRATSSSRPPRTCRSCRIRSASPRWSRSSCVAEEGAGFRLDRRGVRAAFDRAGATYESAAQLQARVAAELIGRLDTFRFEPAVVLDLGAGTGRVSAALKRRYPRAQVLALDLSLGMLRQARHNLRLWRRFTRVCADAQRLPLKSASVDLVFSSLMLQWCEPLDAALAEVRRVLKGEGFFAFSTFGPATLQELRRAWAAADDYNHVNHFIDVHDVGNALVRAGFTEPVLDVDRIELGYPDALALMRDLKAIGAHNVTAGRAHTLTGRARLERMQAAYEGERANGVLPATYEVIYGAAFGGSERRAAALSSGEAHIAPGSIRRRAR